MGYAEDEESVEAIMKKFEELERFKSEVATSSVPLEASGEHQEMSENVHNTLADEVRWIQVSLSKDTQSNTIRRNL